MQYSLFRKILIYFADYSNTFSIFCIYKIWKLMSCPSWRIFT
jgi:hypothetical protein